MKKSHSLNRLILIQHKTIFNSSFTVLIWSSPEIWEVTRWKTENQTIGGKCKVRQICSALRLKPLARGCSKFRGGLIMEKLRLFAVAGVTTPPVELSRYETWGNL